MSRISVDEALSEMAAAYLFPSFGTIRSSMEHARRPHGSARVPWPERSRARSGRVDGLTELVLGGAAGKVSRAETTVCIERHSRARRA